MPAIKPKFISTLNELLTIAINDGVDCPPLVATVQWAMQQNALGTPLIGGSFGSFSQELEAAVANAGPGGITAPQLQSIAQKWNQKPQTVGTTLGRAAKAGRLVKNGKIWTAAGTGTTAKVIRTLAKRRAQKTQATGDGRRRRTASPASTAGNQPQAAAV